MNIYEYKNANTKEQEGIFRILEKHNLPTNDIRPNKLIKFIVAKFNNEIVGSVALELYDNLAMLRSLCVDEKYRSDNVGSSLVNKILDTARNANVTDVYLLTTTADKYFIKFGFKETNRTLAPEPIQNSSQLAEVCPSSAIFMHKKL
ncbi:arsenic resistance N-acetyltransferase ArsN2 [Leptospira sp. 96542]|nr:arsenic resistance N-acetyltransferase ArsN2 [Leptospira sp. 96542]